MKFKWGIFGQVINEEELIEAKIEWALRLGMEVSFVEGYYPPYNNVSKEGLSVDETTEILESYSDRITYEPIGKVPKQRFLRNKAYKNLTQDLDYVIMSDVDEFFLEEDLELIERHLSRRDHYKHVITDSLIFLNDRQCAPHVRRKEGKPFNYTKDEKIWHGQFHERIFKYNKYYSYDLSPFLINDLLGRFIFNDPAYVGDRIIRDDVKMLHYKNFKREKAEKRHQMYKERGDKENYDEEWETLERNAIIYDGNHPPEIEDLI